jgi:hypothetical protein
MGYASTCNKRWVADSYMAHLLPLVVCYLLLNFRHIDVKRQLVYCRANTQHRLEQPQVLCHDTEHPMLVLCGHVEV